MGKKRKVGGSGKGGLLCKKKKGKGFF